ncbi:MAG: HPr family phosphocarrier protein [bacterium]
MVSALITIINKLGLHARAAAKLVQLSNQFSSNISLEKDGEDANAKNIMEVLMLASAKDTQLRIVAEGQDEMQALEEISALINNKFEEEE